ACVQFVGYIHNDRREDLYLTKRFWKDMYIIQLFPETFIYHKRRIDWGKFHTQVKRFGMVRPILNRWHPGTAKPTYWFPTLFTLGFIVSVALIFWGILLPIGVQGDYILILLLEV